MRKAFNHLSLARALADDFISAPQRFYDSLTKRFQEHDHNVFFTPLAARVFALVIEGGILMLQGQEGTNLTRPISTDPYALSAGWMAGMFLLTPLSMKICNAAFRFGDMVFDNSEEEKNTVPMEAFPTFNQARTAPQPE